MRRHRRSLTRHAGRFVQAHVVLKPGKTGDALMTKLLQDHVKQVIGAPTKYPPRIRSSSPTTLPKTQTGKIQRFRLRSEGRGLTDTARRTPH